jgi:hypothetical protein
MTDTEFRDAVALASFSGNTDLAGQLIDERKRGGSSLPASDFESFSEGRDFQLSANGAVCTPLGFIDPDRFWRGTR